MISSTQHCNNYQLRNLNLNQSVMSSSNCKTNQQSAPQQCMNRPLPSTYVSSQHNHHSNAWNPVVSVQNNQGSNGVCNDQLSWNALSLCRIEWFNRQNNLPPSNLVRQHNIVKTNPFIVSPIPWNANKQNLNHTCVIDKGFDCSTSLLFCYTSTLLFLLIFSTIHNYKLMIIITFSDNF